MIGLLKFKTANSNLGNPELAILYTSLFAQNEQHIKKTIKKQQQTTKQTGINTALTKISYHMTC